MMRIHKEGISTIVITFLTSVVISYIFLHFMHYSILSWIISAVLMGFVVFILTFFRNPKRERMGNSTLVSAPADGKVVIVKEVIEEEYIKGPAIQISVFMTFFNVHVNWFPISGEITYYRYHPGNYVAAWHPKSSVKNERTTVVIKNETGQEILCRQIAGLFARRVVCYAELGKKVEAGEQEGFIKFGSRADVFLPIGSKVLVNVGDKVIGSETILAETL